MSSFDKLKNFTIHRPINCVPTPDSKHSPSPLSWFPTPRKNISSLLTKHHWPSPGRPFPFCITSSVAPRYVLDIWFRRTSVLLQQIHFLKQICWSVFSMGLALRLGYFLLLHKPKYGRQKVVYLNEISALYWCFFHHCELANDLIN